MSNFFKAALFTSLLFTGLILNAQDDEEKTPVFIDAQDHFLINFGVENFIYGSKPDGFNQRWKTNGFAFKLMYDKPLGRGNVSVAFGVGISRQNYHTNAIIRSGEATLPNGLTVGVPDAPVHFENIEDTPGFDGNRLSTTFVELPFELRFRTNPNEKGFSWKFYPGFKVGYLSGSHDRQVFNDDKYKWFIFPDISSLRYGPTFRVAYGKVGLFGFYGLNGFFNDGMGPEMNQLSIGLTLMPF